MSSDVVVIFETLYGSRATGLDEAGSDTDVRGIVVGPRAWYLGHRGGPEQIEVGKDHLRFEVRKFVRLAARANPTALEMLYTDPADHIVRSPAGELLLAARARFLTRQVGETFGQYATSQLKRIHTHRRWLLEPPAGPPARATFGLPEHRPVARDQLGAAEGMLADGRLEPGDVPPNFLALLDRERRYERARTEWEQYERWRTTRNPARAALEARHGYDTKHGMHLVRLLRMAVEALGTGELQVRRPDREELLAVKHGAWPYEQLVAHAEALAETARVTPSRLPAAPDEDALEALCVEVVEAAFHERSSPAECSATGKCEV